MIDVFNELYGYARRNTRIYLTKHDSYFWYKDIVSTDGAAIIVKTQSTQLTRQLWLVIVFEIYANLYVNLVIFLIGTDDIGAWL